MKDKEIYGVHVLETRTFYYLDTTGFKISNPLERLEKIMLSRSMLDFNSDHTDRFRRITLETAKKENCVIEVLYLNKHRKENTQPKKEEQGLKWGE